MASVYLSIGSNLGDRFANLRRGLESIKSVPGVSVESVSSIYETEPVGVADQSDFLNAAIKLDTSLDPRELLATLQEIEIHIGRKKTRCWGPRVLDIDILLYDDLVYSDSQLQIPHGHLHERRFVLVPLAEIASNLTLPNNGAQSVTQLIEDCSDTSKVELFAGIKLLAQSKTRGAL